jgi:cytochrome P450
VAALLDSARFVPVQGPTALAHSDPGGFAALRRAFYEALAPASRTAELVDTFEGCAQRLLDDLPSGRVEMVSSFSMPYAARVVATYFGLPADLWLDHFRHWHALKRSTAAPESDPIAAAIRRRDAWRNDEAFEQVLEEVLASRRRDPVTDVLGALVVAADGPGSLEDLDVLRAVPRLARNATLGILDLTSSITLRVVSEGDRSKLETCSIEAVVEEVLRLDPPVQGVERRVEGSAVVLSIQAANRDPRVFGDSFGFDPSRHNLRDHLSFGRGVEACIGAPLARAAASAALRQLLTAGLQWTAHPIERWSNPWNQGVREVWVNRG